MRFEKLGPETFKKIDFHELGVPDEKLPKGEWPCVVNNFGDVYMFQLISSPMAARDGLYSFYVKFNEIAFLMYTEWPVRGEGGCIRVSASFSNNVVSAIHAGLKFEELRIFAEECSNLLYCGSERVEINSTDPTYIRSIEEIIDFANHVSGTVIGVSNLRRLNLLAKRIRESKAGLKREIIRFMIIRKLYEIDWWPKEWQYFNLYLKSEEIHKLLVHVDGYGTDGLNSEARRAVKIIKRARLLRLLRLYRNR
ncbi:MAG: hypothetical protein Q8L20_14330 [Gammaproteobacteria bacterium]|nr:hypothetical protein [Gammaproteobacteria bacterium]